MLVEHRGRRPVVAESAYFADSAVLCGAVVVGERARILHGARVTAEDGEVRIGWPLPRG
jgi:carbonic anhydrase/acetyltransferase-like protein (isoleucine patch superfamily)